MSMPSKGKQATKGQKQIFDENQATRNFYTIMTATSLLIHFVVQMLFFWPSRSEWVGLLSSVSIQGSALYCMRRMAKANFDDREKLLDAGLDLNQEGGFGEYCKDSVILASLVQIVALFWSKFWLLLLLAPAFALYKLWVGILAPWFFAPAPEEDENDEKKRRKKERKVKRI